MVGRLNLKTFWFFLPTPNDEFIRCQTMERFEALGDVVGIQKDVQVLFELVVAFVVIALHRCVLQGPVHPLDLTVVPWMVGLGQPVLDPVFQAHRPKDMLERVPIPLPIRELDAVVGQDNLDAVGDGGNQIS